MVGFCSAGRRDGYRHDHPFYMSISWTIGCPDIWSAAILGVSSRVCLVEMNIVISRIKQIALYYVVGLI